MYAHALEGGLLIGAAAALLVLSTGRIAGISGIFSHFIRGELGDGAWRLAFLVGLVVAPLSARLAGIGVVAPSLTGGLATALVGGLLSGLGAGLAGGCTSGHGVCGLSNLSLRSLVATTVFMGTAVVTVFIVRHALGTTA